ncbi:MAG TPA: hypothetical protein VHC39_16270 [Rhizomicrobium sp.]|nr:hypothetical protein [Rhizomicrobium sp.]
MFRFFLAAIIIFCGPIVASATETSLQKGQSFFFARAALLHEGWKPVETSENESNGDGHILHSWGDAEPFYKHGYREVGSCTGMEADYCHFNYRRADRCLFLVTAGEYSAPGARNMPTVNNWWTYPLLAKRSCSDDAAHTVKFKQFGQHSFP